MRVVIDSNVWIAALATSGTSKDVVQETLARCEVTISPYIVQEVDRALARKLHATSSERQRVRQWIQAVCRVVDAPCDPSITFPDASDIPVLSLTKAIHADILITGDHALVQLNAYQGCHILPPAQFWKHLFP